MDKRLIKESYRYALYGFYIDEELIYTMEKKFISEFGNNELYGYYVNGELKYKECDLKNPDIKRNARIIRNAESKIADNEKFPPAVTSPLIEERIKRTKEKLRKLTPEQVRDIRKNIAQGVSMRNIAAMYDVCAETIQGIKNGRTYADIE